MNKKTSVGEELKKFIEGELKECVKEKLESQAWRDATARGNIYNG